MRFSDFSEKSDKKFFSAYKTPEQIAKILLKKYKPFLDDLNGKYLIGRDIGLSFYNNENKDHNLFLYTTQRYRSSEFGGTDMHQEIYNIIQTTLHQKYNFPLRNQNVIFCTSISSESMSPFRPTNVDEERGTWKIIFPNNYKNSGAVLSEADYNYIIENCIFKVNTMTKNVISKYSDELRASKFEKVITSHMFDNNLIYNYVINDIKLTKNTINTLIYKIYDVVINFYTPEKSNVIDDSTFEILKQIIKEIFVKTKNIIKNFASTKNFSKDIFGEANKKGSEIRINTDRYLGMSYKTFEAVYEILKTEGYRFKF